MNEMKVNVFRKLWQFCRSLLSEENITYEEYTHQLEYLMFIKMASEYAEATKSVWPLVPHGFEWHSLLLKNGEELIEHYQRALEVLRDEPGMVGELFKNATNSIKNPDNLRELIEIVDQETWAKIK